MKICTLCNEQLLCTQFHKNKATKDGLHSNCKKCRNAYMATVYKKNYEKNIESIKISRKKYYQKNKEKINRYHGLWVEKNKEKYVQYHADYNAKIKEMNKKYKDFYLQHHK